MSNTIPPRDLAGRFGGQGASQTKTLGPTTMFTKLDKAECNLRLALTTGIEHLAKTEAVAEGTPVPAIVVAASLGAGKSRIARELLGGLAGNDPIVFHAPTLALSEEAAGHAHELAGNAHVIRGRAAAETTHPEQTHRLGRGLVPRRCYEHQ